MSLHDLTTVKDVRKVTCLIVVAVLKKTIGFIRLIYTI